jgi:hypothetical protein
MEIARSKSPAIRQGFLKNPGYLDFSLVTMA